MHYPDIILYIFKSYIILGTLLVFVKINTIPNNKLHKMSIEIQDMMMSSNIEASTPIESSFHLDGCVEESKLSSYLMYSIGATAMDCSIMLTFRRLPNTKFISSKRY